MLFSFGSRVGAPGTRETSPEHSGEVYARVQGSPWSLRVDVFSCSELFTRQVQS